MSNNNNDYLDMIKTTIEKNISLKSLFISYIYEKSYADLNIESIDAFNKKNTDNCNSLLIVINNRANIIMEYLEQLLVNNNILLSNDDSLNSNNKLIYTKLQSKTPINLFEGELIHIYKLKKIPGGEQYISCGTIAIEINPNVNIQQLNTQCISLNSTQQRVLNINGFIIIHYFTPYVKNIDAYLFKCYDSLPPNFLLPKFLTSIDIIFKKCTFFYTHTSVNILQKILSYKNPITTNVPYDNSDNNSMNIVGGEQSQQQQSQVLILPNNIEKTNYTYKDIDTEINALTLESTFSINSSQNKFNLRCLINVFIMFINHIILDNNKLGYCVKSGGEVYRYYGNNESYTNDIDTKLFFDPNISNEQIYNAQKNIITYMMCLRYLIKTQNNLKNVHINKKQTTLFGYNIILTFGNVNADFDTSVRSILIPITTNKKTSGKFLHNNGGIRLFSLDAYYSLNIAISQNNSLQTIFSYDGIYSAAPLDIANSPRDKLDVNRNVISTPTNIPNQSMYILSPLYLKNDLKMLMKSPERIEKRTKDEARLLFINNILEKNNQVNHALLPHLNNMCNVNYEIFTNHLNTVLQTNHTEIMNYISLFEDTLTINLNKKLPNTRFKTPITNDSNIYFGGKKNIKIKQNKSKQYKQYKQYKHTQNKKQNKSKRCNNVKKNKSKQHNNKNKSKYNFTIKK